MAFQLSGVTTVSMKPEALTRELDGEDVVIQLLPLTAPMNRAAMERAKVRADQSGLMVMTDMARFQRELAVEVFDSWTIENGNGQTAKITSQVVEWLMDYSDDAVEMVKDAIVRAKDLYEERR